MKLKIVPARTGIQWVKLGIRTFFKQPLALSGLFVLLWGITWIVGQIPVIGSTLVVALLPAFTLGFMAASKEADAGVFPMPSVFFSAFRAGRQQLRAIMLLGLMYALGLWAITAISALFDNGVFASRHLAGQVSPFEMAKEPATQTAALVFLMLQLPLSLMLWHAPALVHWHQVPPIKSMFFSLVACVRNFWAFALFSLAWTGVVLLAMLVVGIVAQLSGDPGMFGKVLMPAFMLVSTMVVTSTYFTFRDSFETGEAP